MLYLCGLVWKSYQVKGQLIRIYHWLMCYVMPFWIGLEVISGQGSADQNIQLINVLCNTIGDWSGSHIRSKAWQQQKCPQQLEVWDLLGFYFSSVFSHWQLIVVVLQGFVIATGQNIDLINELWNTFIDWIEIVQGKGVAPMPSTSFGSAFCTHIWISVKLGQVDCYGDIFRG